MSKKIALWSAVVFLALSTATASVAMPQSGRVDGLFHLRWEKPHAKGNRLHLTFINDGDVFQPLKGTLYIEDDKGDAMGKAAFDLGIPPRKSVRAYGDLERDGDLSSARVFRWVLNR